MADLTSQADNVAVSKTKIVKLLDKVLVLEKKNTEDKELIIETRRKLLKTNK